MSFRMPPMPFPMPLLFITAVKDICAINTFTSEGILRQRDKVKITDQSEALFKQKRWFKTKTNDLIASRLEMGL